MFEMKLLPKVDGYVTRSVLVLLGMCTLALCFIVSVVDAFQRMDEFLEFAERADYSFLQTGFLVVNYYLCISPQYFIQYMVPFVSMLSGIIVVSVMASHREFVALRASGVPLQRVLLPVAVTVFIVGLGLFLLRDALVPFLAREAHAVSARMKKKGSKPVTVVLSDGDTIRTYMMGHFDPVRGQAFNFRVEERSRAEWLAGHTDRYSACIDPAPSLVAGEWNLTLRARRYIQYDYYRDEGASVERKLPTRVTPAILEQESLGSVVMTSDDLARLSDDRSMRIELAQRRTLPLSGLAILLVGIGLVVRGEREASGSRIGRVKSIILAIGVCAAFYVVQSAFIGLAERGFFGPMSAAWFPVLLFGVWGGYSFWRVNM